MPPPIAAPPRLMPTLLGGALVASLCLNAYLLGQQSVQPQIVQVVQAPPAEVAAATPDTGLPGGPAKSTRALPTESPSDRPSVDRNAEVLLAAERAEAAAEAAEASEDGAKEAARASIDSEREAVSTYLRQVDLLLSASQSDKAAADEAEVVLVQVVEGNSQGLTRLRREGEANLRQLRALPVPPACLGYHRRVITTAEQGVDLLLEAENAANSGDLETVARLGPKASIVRDRAQSLQADRQVLRDRFGLR